MTEPVVVTGAAGFIGTHLTRALAERGLEVRAVDLAPEPPVAGLHGVRYFREDIRDTDALRPLLQGADTVFHLASAHLQVTADDAHYRAVNVGAAERLVRASADAGVRRFVHTGTVGIYGHVADPPAREDAPTAPGNIYERTKLEGDVAVRGAAAATGLDLIVIRPAWVYGPGCPRMAKLLRGLESGRFLYVGEGRNLRHPVYVDDAVDAFLLAAAAPPELAGRVYLVAGPRYMELRELVETCARVLGVPTPRKRLPRFAVAGLGRVAELVWGLAGREPPISRRSLLFFENDNAFDISAARRDLGFDPRVELEEGVRRTLTAERAPSRPSEAP